ncbi:MAG: hypothetical protein U9Q89_05830, partial [Thermodesulfobacteriota bacterium]|nr:hypothetical protein [Thermodesulfobacteriota bacterium]
MKRFIFSNNIMGSLRLVFFFVVLAIFTISPFHFDVADGIYTDSLLAMDLFIKENTLVKNSATGKEVPFSELKSKNPKLSSSLNQLVSARKHNAEFSVNAFAKERGMKVKDDLIQVVIEIKTDSHEPVAEGIIDSLRDRIIHAGGKVELDFHNLLQVLLPVEALEEAASWPEVKFVREPFRAHPIKDGSEVQDQTNGDLLKSNQIQKYEESRFKIPGTNSLDDLICSDKNVEIFFPGLSKYEQIPKEEAENNEDFLKQGMYLKREQLDSANAFAGVYFCTEYNCSLTVTFGGLEHPSKLSCYTALYFEGVPPGSYSYKAIGCDSTEIGSLNVEAGYDYLIWFCPVNPGDCCPTGCGSEGSYLCEKCGSP